jgi:beta-glucanase (GH16 family)
MNVLKFLQRIPMKKIMRFLMMAFLLASMGLAAESDMTVEAKNGFHPETAEPANTNSKQRSAIVWQTTWSDEFNGSGSIDASRWICDTGTSYPGGPANWGTGEVEIYTCDTSNIFESGGYLNIRALHSGTDPQTNWTSARIETVSADFQPPVGGSMAVEARIQLPNVNSTNGLGYWPAFWMLGAPYRGNYQNWPGIGEIDVMENANGLNRWIGALHCGTNPNGPCNEPSGIGSYLTDFDPSLQSAFHTFRVEIDRSVAPEQIRWYVDGINTFTVNANQMDETTWTNAIDHGFFILLNVAMGGGLPNALAGNTTPTSDTVSNGTMLVDYVHVEYSMQPPNSIGSCLHETSRLPLGSCSRGCQLYGRNRPHQLLRHLLHHRVGCDNQNKLLYPCPRSSGSNSLLLARQSQWADQFERLLAGAHLQNRQPAFGSHIERTGQPGTCHQPSSPLRLEQFQPARPNLIQSL